MIRRDEQGERTHMPTPLRLAEARRRGQVARSAELAAVLPALAAIGLLGEFGPRLLNEMVRMTGQLLDARNAPIDASAHASVSVLPALGPVLLALAPLVLAVMTVAILANVVQVGFLATAETIRPDVARLSPAEGVRRVFSLRSAVRIALAVAKIAAVAAVAYATIRQAMPRILSAAGKNAWDLGAEAGRCVYQLGLRVGGVLLAVAAVDWCYQRWQHGQDLKMTRREWLEDLKRMEGDPQVRGRRRQTARQLSAERSAEDVASSAVVVAGKGVCVALSYDETMPSPRVIAKAAGPAAGRIRRAAESSGVPVAEDAPLAAALNRRCRTGREIPKALYDSVADVLASAGRANPQVGTPEDAQGTRDSEPSKNVYENPVIRVEGILPSRLGGVPPPKDTQETQESRGRDARGTRGRDGLDTSHARSKGIDESGHIRDI